MVKDSKPRRGSMAYYPRARAKSIVARIRSWPEVDEVRPLGFAGYKVGMIHVYMIEDNPNSPFYGREVFKAVTVLECPPLVVVGVRLYENTPYGLKTLTEIWHPQLPKYIDRVFTVPKNLPPLEESLKKIEEVKDRVHKVRLIVCTQPWRTGIGKKKPEVFEIEIGGKPNEALKYALDKLGKELKVSDVFKEGEYVDVIAVTKGKGFQGVVKRFGVKILPRWHKHRKGARRIGSIGPTKPAVMFTTPRAGQMGFHQRTEYNKRILKIGDNPEEINPKGGFKHYGIIRNQYVLIEGSVPGATKRLIKLRVPIRPRKIIHTSTPQITYISTVGTPSK